jgi:transposase
MGYASKTEAILALRAKGMTDREIAPLVGLSPKTLASMVSKWKRVHAEGRTIKLPPNVFHDLKREGRRRSLTPDEMAKQVLTAVCADRLFAALLDD